NGLSGSYEWCTRPAFLAILCLNGTFERNHRVDSGQKTSDRESSFHLLLLLNVELLQHHVSNALVMSSGKHGLSFRVRKGVWGQKPRYISSFIDPCKSTA